MGIGRKILEAILEVAHEKRRDNQDYRAQITHIAKQDLSNTQLAATIQKES